MNFISRIRKHKKYVILSIVIVLVLVFSLLPSDTIVIKEEKITESVLEEIIIKEVIAEETVTEEAVVKIVTKPFNNFMEELDGPRKNIVIEKIHIYREVPPMVDPNFFVQPDGILYWQAGYISRWDNIINLYLPNRPELDLLLVLSVIAQESQGDEKLVTYDPDFLNNSLPGVGLMMISPKPWTGTIPWLLSPLNNISVGSYILNVTIRDAREVHNFAPGLDSIRAGLAAYNCGWTSLLADRCWYFGGWAYADKVLLYWYPMLLERYEGEFEVPDYFKDIEL